MFNVRRLVINVVIAAVALGVGFGIKAATGSDSHTEAPKPAATLKTADYNDGWEDGVGDLLDQVTNSVCEANSIAYADVPACVKLYLRPATTHHQADGTVTSDPAGPTLVAECLSQYQGVELHSCLTQPAS